MHAFRKLARSVLVRAIQDACHSRQTPRREQARAWLLNIDHEDSALELWCSLHGIHISALITGARYLDTHGWVMPEIPPDEDIDDDGFMSMHLGGLNKINSRRRKLTVGEDIIGALEGRTNHLVRAAKRNNMKIIGIPLHAYGGSSAYFVGDDTRKKDSSGF